MYQCKTLGPLPARRISLCLVLSGLVSSSADNRVNRPPPTSETPDHQGDGPFRHSGAPFFLPSPSPSLPTEEATDPRLPGSIAFITSSPFPPKILLPGETWAVADALPHLGTPFLEQHPCQQGPLTLLINKTCLPLRSLKQHFMAPVGRWSVSNPIIWQTRGPVIQCSSFRSPTSSTRLAEKQSPLHSLSHQPLSFNIARPALLRPRPLRSFEPPLYSSQQKRTRTQFSDLCVQP